MGGLVAVSLGYTPRVSWAGLAPVLCAPVPAAVAVGPSRWPFRRRVL